METVTIEIPKFAWMAATVLMYAATLNIMLGWVVKYYAARFGAKKELKDQENEAFEMFKEAGALFLECKEAFT